jgi:hypothetical protein
VQTIKLDATAAGRPVYAALGFVEESLIERWEGVAPAGSAAALGRSWTAADWPQVLTLDRRAFGADRGCLLRTLHDEALAALVVPVNGQVQGFALARPGATRSYLGPLVATEETTALNLLEASLSQLAGQTVFIDLNARLAHGRAWLAAHGFTIQRTLLRMRAGAPSHAGTSPYVLAVAGLEVG